MTRSGSLAIAVTVAALLTLARLPSTIRMLDNRAASGGALTGIERELPAAQQYGIPADALRRLSALIPPHAIYTIQMPGQGADVGALAFPGIVGNALLPRRNAPDAAQAQFVVGYHVSLPKRLGHVTNVGGGIQVAQVRP